GVIAAEAPDEISERTGHKKILLQEAQSLPLARGVVRIENASERLSCEFLGHGPDEIAMTEPLKIEVIWRCRRPEAKRINRLSPIPNHRSIKGDTDQAGRLANDRAQAATAQLERAVQFDFDLLIWTQDLPGVRATEPVVRLLLLPAILDGLPEDAVFVPQ